MSRAKLVGQRGGQIHHHAESADRVPEMV